MDQRPIMFFAIFALFLIPGALGISISGGASANIGADSSAQGNFVADDTGAVSTASALGSIPHVGELRYVQDKSEKRAEMSFNVINAVGEVGYSAIFAPKEGTLRTTATQVSARQNLKVSKADSIALHSAAQSAPGSNVVDVELIANKIDSPASPASFSGSTLSQAGARNALAMIQGRAIGAIHGTASYGGLDIDGPYDTTKERDSSGQKVESNLLLQAASNNGIGTLSGVSTFNVDIDKNEKIQSAVDAAWDGDTINIAKGTYKENIMVDRPVTIARIGAGKVIVDGDNKGSVFNIGPFDSTDKKAVLSGITIQGGSGTGGGIFNAGNLIVASCIISGNTAKGLTGDAGGIYNDGTLTIKDSIVSGNTANDYSGEIVPQGGGIFNDLHGVLTADKLQIYGNIAGYAGGIYNAGTLKLKCSTIYDNKAEVYDGGGILNNGDLSIDNCDIYRNSAYDFGGGIENWGGKVNVVNSRVFGNAAQGGAGISNSGSMNIKGSKIFSNDAGWEGGGIVNYDDQVNVAAVNLIDSSVYGNTAFYYGGGIANDGALGTGTVTITNGKISENTGFIGGGVWNSLAALVMNSGSIASNTATSSGGGIYNDGTLSLAGTSQITNNKAATGYGGGIYSTTNSVTFDGKKVSIKSNKAHLPSPSELSWYQGWGVYTEGGSPIMTGGFDPAKQVTGNTQI